mmetsp:Transcript_4991/g.14470  ORF Transcript_4991/g.14470 Transcript_4991/m.14470 type:complete len:199 (-) Transcript_4991:2343-2939(-)|eukprot:CAMPEP_0172403116 /NCGR_PEP_ID=MMETSP1061-20121228/57840_1 /TAXON_ID=37318 /ORGANISM="Pseudo-nitzschia pungens, Strain cf. pungens" /LENGTH=198 /DNA_ID=CAMNT_0013137377 /DNA_START=185 /DNA_END=781 /DNA_ORIENTATION=+
MSFQHFRQLFLVYCALLCASGPFSAEAFSAKNPSRQTASLEETSSRRDWLAQTGFGGIAAIVATTAAASFPQAALADSGEYVTELKASLTKLQPIPKMLEEQKWDEVRTILKTPPVNKLWNLGDSQNTVLKLVKETGNVELFEVKDDLAYNLQMCDQLTYDNNFIYYQPGNGKLKIKEPIDAVNKALTALQSIIEESS